MPKKYSSIIVRFFMKRKFILTAGITFIIIGNLCPVRSSDIPLNYTLNNQATIKDKINFYNMNNQKNDVGIIVERIFSSGVEHIHLPCGEYLIKSTIHMGSGKTLQGDGSCTIFYSVTPSSDLIDVNGSYDKIENIRFRNNQTKTGGAVIAAKKTFRLTIDNVVIECSSSNKPWWNGIALYGANDTHISNLEIRPGGLNSALQISGTEDTGRSEDTYVTSTNINGWRNNLELSWASGNYLSNMDILGATFFGVLFDPSKFQEVDGTRASQVLSDSNTSDGWRFEGNGAITETSLTNCWGSTNGYRPGTLKVLREAAGLRVVNSHTNNLTINSSEFHSNTGNGIELDTGENILIHSNSLFMNGTYTDNQSLTKKIYYYGILVKEPSSFISIIGNMGGLGGEAISHGLNKQKYFIEIESYNNIIASLNMGNKNLENDVVHSMHNPGKSIIISENIGN